MESIEHSSRHRSVFYEADMLSSTPSAVTNIFMPTDHTALRSLCIAARSVPWLRW